MGIKSISVALTTLILSTSVNSATLTHNYTNVLDNQLATSSSNFHPQGLGYDTGSNELLFIQQGSMTIYRTDLAGTITGSLAMPSFAHHTTSVAGDGVNYYFSDYTGNTRGLDLYSIDKLSGSSTAISSEVAAYGGYPIDVRDGNMYRTETSNSYSWSSLSQIRISAISSVDTTLQTVTLATSNGIGDIAIDSINNNVWVIDYNSNASLRQFDLTTGNELASFALGLDGFTGGLTYADDTLYYYDWNSGSGSTLSAYSISSVPVPAAVWLFGSGLLGLIGVARRKKT